MLILNAKLRIFPLEIKPILLEICTFAGSLLANRHYAA